ALRSLHEPQLLEAKIGVARTVLETCPPLGGRVKLTGEQADSWLAALNDVRLALGTALDVEEDMPEELPEGDPRQERLGEYRWLPYVQDSLAQALMSGAQAAVEAGKLDAIGDEPGDQEGHWQQLDDHWATGVSAVLVREGTVSALDVRVGGP